MNEISPNHPALLPAGLRDVLPPEAEIEARTAGTIMDCFAARGYQRVKPPLLEFGESLFAGAGAAMADQTLRLMDPDSQRMLGLRADTTPQVGRLAITRLSDAPRPLRLAYSGQCLRLRGTHLQPERQIAQAGIELIGNDTAEADAEIILTAAEAVEAVGLNNISFDLTVPQLVLSLLSDVQFLDRPALTRALDRKDHAAVANLGGSRKLLLLKLLEASGPVERAIPALLAIDLPKAAKIQAERVAETVRAIHQQNPKIVLTTDPVEFRGYQYHTGICMTVFAPGRQAELGRGGRYLCGQAEPATGITLYPDMIVRVAPPPNLRKRLYVPYGTQVEYTNKLRRDNFATIAGLSPNDSPALEAIRLNCSHYVYNGEVIPVSRDLE